jgi:hypothetical protein
MIDSKIREWALFKPLGGPATWDQEDPDAGFAVTGHAAFTSYHHTLSNLC